MTRPIYALGLLKSNTRNQRILTLTDLEKARSVPKYNLPEKLVYQTPAAHRIFTKTSTMSSAGEEKLQMKIATLYLYDQKPQLGQVAQLWPVRQ